MNRVRTPILFAMTFSLLWGTSAAAQMSSEAEQFRQLLEAVAEDTARVASAVESSGAEGGEAIAQIASETAISWSASDLESLDLLYQDITSQDEVLLPLEQAHLAIGELASSLEGAAVAGKARDDDSDWPTKQCSIGPEFLSSWDISTTLINVTQALRHVQSLAVVRCKKISIDEILGDRFGFGADKSHEQETCRAELEVCNVTITPEKYTGRGMLASGGGGGTMTTVDPALGKSCENMEKMVIVLERLQTVFNAFSDCWTQGTAIANNGRLTEIRSQVEEVQGKLEVLTRLVVEGNLAVRGGLRIGTLYLPGEEAGGLELVRGYAQEAIEKTSDAGYRMMPEIDVLWAQAEAYRADGNVKRAYDAYRAAYSRATVKSFKLEAK